MDSKKYFSKKDEGVLKYDCVETARERINAAFASIPKHEWETMRKETFNAISCKNYIKNEYLEPIAYTVAKNVGRLHGGDEHYIEAPDMPGIYITMHKGGKNRISVAEKRGDRYMDIADVDVDSKAVRFDLNAILESSDKKLTELAYVVNMVVYRL